MNEKLLCRCTSSIAANNVANVLDVNSIVYRMHDETADPRNGAYGPNPGTAFYVSENDYQEASALVEPITNRPSVRYAPFCPKCGSEDAFFNGECYECPCCDYEWAADVEFEDDEC